MSNRGVVFVSSDYLLDPWLRELGGDLHLRGYEVIEGPPQRPPAKIEYAAADWPRWFGRADVIVTTTHSIIPRELLAAAQRLRGVVFPMTGTESIDMDAAGDLGIIVAHGPTPENFNSTAESTVMLMLALMYDLHATERVLRDSLPRPTRMKARLMLGKTIGLIGFGRVARGIAERLANWGVKIVAFDPYCPKDEVPHGVEWVEFDTLLAVSDIVSVHTTLSDETRRIIDAEALALMKPSAYLVNTARGGLVDEAALYDALLEGRIAGAAIDTYELEPLPEDSPLRTLDNIVLTPHMVGHTQDVFDAVVSTALDNLARIMKGETPLYCGNPQALPAWRRRVSALGTQGAAPSAVQQ